MNVNNIWLKRRKKKIQTTLDGYIVKAARRRDPQQMKCKIMKMTSSSADRECKAMTSSDSDEVRTLNEGTNDKENECKVMTSSVSEESRLVNENVDDIQNKCKAMMTSSDSEQIYTLNFNAIVKEKWCKVMTSPLDSQEIRSLDNVGAKENELITSQDYNEILILNDSVGDDEENECKVTMTSSDSDQIRILKDTVGDKEHECKMMTSSDFKESRFCNVSGKEDECEVMTSSDSEECQILNDIVGAKETECKAMTSSNREEYPTVVKDNVVHDDIVEESDDDEIQPLDEKALPKFSVNDSIFNDSYNCVKKSMDNNRPGYVYKSDIVRKRDERKKLCGYVCNCCRGYFDALNLTPEEKERRINSVSRHRDHQAPPSTPEHFWDVGFPSTPELIARSEKYYGKDGKSYSKKKIT